MSEYLTPRPTDRDLEEPPPDVVIDLLGLAKGDHWSAAIVEDRRPAFKAEFCVDRSWATNALVFNTAEEAATYARDLFMRWTAPTAWRVVDADGVVHVDPFDTGGPTRTTMRIA